MVMAKKYRSKYNFSTSKVGDTFRVKVSDIESVTNSLRAYNKRNNESIEIEIEKPTQEVTFKRIQ